MTKRFMLILLFALCTSLWAGVADDGVISTGEYDYGIVEWTSSYPPLIVNGGGANWISIRNEGKLEVYSTSTPINGDWDTGGIRDIDIDDYGNILYMGGETDILTTNENATAVLRGGKINFISSRQHTTIKHIDLYCKPGWSWISDDPLIGIQGVWLDSGLPFSIDFINDDTFGYDPVYMNINVITPEPTTLALLGLGGLLLGKHSS